jgi:hypothetical protein
MLPEIQAEQQLLAIEAASLPHMKDEDRRGIFARYQSRLRGLGKAQPRSAHQALMQARIRVKRTKLKKRPKQSWDKPGQVKGDTGG